MNGGEEGFFKALERWIERLREPESIRDIVYLFLLMVPLGCTVTYGVLARLAGTSPRAVGRFMSMNEVLIVVPCHRVVAARGLGGFSKGIDFKLRLLELEGAADSRGRLSCVIGNVEEYWDVLEREGRLVLM